MRFLPGLQLRKKMTQATVTAPTGDGRAGRFRNSPASTNRFVALFSTREAAPGALIGTVQIRNAPLLVRYAMLGYRKRRKVYHACLPQHCEPAQRFLPVARPG
jgi:hypothetical protein